MDFKCEYFYDEMHGYFKCTVNKVKNSTKTQK